MKVSIVCLTYNHEKFIKNALNGFIGQRTNFDYEVIVHDDASEDGTQKIILEYASKYPSIIHPILQKTNQYSKGIYILKKFIFPKIRGDYVIFCEGDDYWIDCYKLQKQVIFLDNNLDCSMVFHPVLVHWEDLRRRDKIFPSVDFIKNRNFFVFEELLEKNFIPTCSVMYRWRFHSDSNDLMPDDIFPTDWFLHLLHAQIGKVGFLSEIMAVYCRHSAGVWTGAEQSGEWFRVRGLPFLRFYIALQNQFDIDCKEKIEDLAFKVFYSFKVINDQDGMNKLKELYPLSIASDRCSVIKFVCYYILSFFLFGELRKKNQKKERKNEIVA